MTAVVEASQNNFAAMKTMSAATLASITAIGQRQAEMMRTSLEEFSRHGSEMMGLGSAEEKAVKHLDFARKSYEAAVLELADLYAKNREATLATIKDRIASLSEEIKAAFAQK